jgi:anti-sigma B factor antagonist
VQIYRRGIREVAMHFQTTVLGSHPTVVALVGELDIATVPIAETCLSSVAGDIEIDCSALEFVDASGLALFVSAHARCQDEGSKLVLVDPSPLLVRLLQITDLEMTLNVRSDEVPAG